MAVVVLPNEGKEVHVGWVGWFDAEGRRGLTEDRDA